MRFRFCAALTGAAFAVAATTANAVSIPFAFVGAVTYGITTFESDGIGLIDISDTPSRTDPSRYAVIDASGTAYAGALVNTAGTIFTNPITGVDPGDNYVDITGLSITDFYISFTITGTQNFDTIYNDAGSAYSLSTVTNYFVPIDIAFGDVPPPPPPVSVPEPATWTIMLLGLGAMGAELRRRRSTDPLTGANA